MKKIYIILLSIITIISSCTKHEDIIDTSLQPGSILCSDGSIVHPSLFSPSEKEAIGVVFWCNDGNNPNIKETAYAVSLEDLEEKFLINTDEDIANVSEDENSFDGAANTAAIMNFAIKDSIAYPAAQKAIEYAPKVLQVGLLALLHKIKQSLTILKKYILLSQSLEVHTLMVGTGVLQKMEQAKILLKFLRSFLH